MGRVVLVTGVSRDLGSRFARLVAADPSVDRVIGVDVVPPRGDLGDVRFIRADIRNPVITKVIAGEDVDTVVHMSVIASPGTAGGRTSMKELNVIGTMQLLAACQKAPGLEHLVVKSSTAVYGSSSRDPAMFSEDMAPKRMPRSGYAQGRRGGRGLRPRASPAGAPTSTVTMLRAANSIGPSVSSPMTQYFKLPVVPTVLGFDARTAVPARDGPARRVPCMRPRQGSTAPSTSPATAYSCCRRRSAAWAAPTVPMPSFALSAVGSLIRQARVADLSAGADGVPELRPRCGHHPDALACSASSRTTRPRPPSRTSDASIAPGLALRGTGRRPSRACVAGALGGERG